eukprot:m51a1_g12346 hypothetical protein (919) ;mRNA; f:522853-526023
MRFAGVVVGVVGSPVSEAKDVPRKRAQQQQAPLSPFDFVAASDCPRRPPRCSSSPVAAIEALKAPAEPAQSAVSSQAGLLPQGAFQREVSLSRLEPIDWGEIEMADPPPPDPHPALATNVLCPLWVSVERDDAASVKSLLAAGATPDQRNSVSLRKLGCSLATPLCAARTPAVTRALLQGGADPLAVCPPLGEEMTVDGVGIVVDSSSRATPLAWAMRAGHWDVAAEIAQRSGSDSELPPEMVRSLTCGDDYVVFRDNDGPRLSAHGQRWPLLLRLSARIGRADWVERLLSASRALATSDACAAMGDASQQGTNFDAIVRSLARAALEGERAGMCDAVATVTGPASVILVEEAALAIGDRAVEMLRWACSRSDMPTIKASLKEALGKEGALTPGDFDQLLRIVLAADKPTGDAASLLIEAGADPLRVGRPSMESAAARGDARLSQMFISAASSRPDFLLNARREEADAGSELASTMFFLACGNPLLSSDEVIALLRVDNGKRGAAAEQDHLRAVDASGHTALIRAIALSSVDIVRSLIIAGAPLDHPSEEALWLALAAAKDDTKAEILLDAGLSLSAGMRRKDTGTDAKSFVKFETPLVFAARSSPSLVRAMLVHGSIEEIASYLLEKGERLQTLRVPETASESFSWEGLVRIGAKYDKPRLARLRLLYSLAERDAPAEEDRVWQTALSVLRGDTNAVRVAGSDVGSRRFSLPSGGTTDIWSIALSAPKLTVISALVGCAQSPIPAAVLGHALAWDDSLLLELLAGKELDLADLSTAERLQILLKGTQSRPVHNRPSRLMPMAARRPSSGVIALRLLNLLSDVWDHASVIYRLLAQGSLFAADLLAAFDSELIPPSTSSLCVACSAGNVSVAEMLLDRGADPNGDPAGMGFSPLRIAVSGAWRSSDELVALLLKHGAT